MANPLDKFGVPVVGSQRQMMKQPKRKDHFRVVFFGFGGDSTPISLEANNVGTPSVEYQSHEVNAYNSKMYYKGKYTWSTIDVSVRDTIDNEPLMAVLSQLKKEFDHENQAVAVSAAKYKFDMVIETLDGSNAGDATGVLNKWLCRSCMITNFQSGDGLDYSDSNYVSFTMTIQPDTCQPLDAANKELSQPLDKGWLADAWNINKDPNLGQSQSPY